MTYEPGQEEHKATTQPGQDDPEERSEIFQVFLQMKTDLGIPVKKIEEFAKVFEENEVYTKKGLFMLSEEQVNDIA